MFDPYKTFLHFSRLVPTRPFLSDVHWLPLRDLLGKRERGRERERERERARDRETSETDTCFTSFYFYVNYYMPSLSLQVIIDQRMNEQILLRVFILYP